nr:AraC family transcriptional regulator [Pinirhizobacter soli]
MNTKTHVVTVHRASLTGVEAISLRSEHVFPRHAHDHYGIGVMSEGAQKSWSVVGAVEAGKGDVIMVNPGEMHDGSPIQGPRAWHIVYFDPDLLSHELADDERGTDVVFNPVANDQALAGKVTALLHAIQFSEPHEAEESLLTCMLHILQQHRLSGSSKTDKSPPVARAIEWIEAEPDINQPLSALAAASDMSRFQLIRGFIRDVGTTPHAYRMQYRVRLARRHLLQGRPIAETAQLMGFADQSHLTRAFLRQFGVAPGRYLAAR